jgi:hypothetical protein
MSKSEAAIKAVKQNIKSLGGNLGLTIQQNLSAQKQRVIHTEYAPDLVLIIRRPIVEAKKKPEIVRSYIYIGGK